MNQITILDYVCLSFLTILSSGLDRGHGFGASTKVVEVLVRDYLGLDESFFEIAMDGTSGLWCEAAPLDGPASDFLLASYQNRQLRDHLFSQGGRNTCEIVLQSELVESFRDDLVQLALDLALLQKCGLLCGIFAQFVQLLLKLN